MRNLMALFTFGATELFRVAKAQFRSGSGKTPLPKL
jgi:hypothetical protein